MNRELTGDGYEVRLIRVRDATSVVGSLVALTTKHLDDFRIVWRERLRTSADEDQYWDWEQKQRIYLLPSCDKIISDRSLQDKL